MLASLTISGASTGVEAVVNAAAGGVGSSSEADVLVLVGQRIEITLDAGGTEYEGVVTIEIEME